MNILIIDTTTADLVVIAVKSEQIFDGTVKNAKTAHSELLCTTVDKTLKTANMTFQDLDVYACAIGPGSFTGIRIGVSTVKGFYRACPKKLVAIDNLNLLSFSSGEGVKSAVIDAGNGWYYGEYNGCECVVEPQLVEYEDEKAQNAVKAINGDVVNCYVSYVQSMVKLGKYAQKLVPLYIRKSQAEVMQGQ